MICCGVERRPVLLTFSTFTSRQQLYEASSYILLIRPSPPSLEMDRIKVSIVSEQWTSACYHENNFICKIADPFVKLLFSEEEKCMESLSWHTMACLHGASM